MGNRLQRSKRFSKTRLLRILDTYKMKNRDELIN